MARFSNKKSVNDEIFSTMDKLKSFKITEKVLNNVIATLDSHLVILVKCELKKSVVCEKCNDRNPISLVKELLLMDIN